MTHDHTLSPTTTHPPLHHTSQVLELSMSSCSRELRKTRAALKASVTASSGTTGRPSLGGVAVKTPPPSVTAFRMLRAAVRL